MDFRGRWRRFMQLCVMFLILHEFQNFSKEIIGNNLNVGLNFI